MELSAPERRRLVAHAKKRKLKVATAARVFLEEHLGELDDRAELTAAEEWQRAQAWATWEKIKSEDVRETTLEELHEVIAKARRSVSRRSRHGKRSG